jgi:hypothetical protein
LYSLKVQAEDVIFRDITPNDTRFEEQLDQPMKLAKEFLLNGTIAKKMKWKAWREKEENRKSQIKQLEKDREARRYDQSIKKSKRASRNFKMDKVRSSPLEKIKRKAYVRKRHASTPVSECKLPLPNSIKRFRPGNHSESRKFKKIQSVKTGRIKKWASFGSIIEKNRKVTSILSYWPLKDKKLNEEREDQIGIAESLVLLSKSYVKPTLASDLIGMEKSASSLPVVVPLIESGITTINDEEPLTASQPPQDAATQSYFMEAGSVTEKDLPNNIVSSRSNGTSKRNNNSGVIESILQLSELDGEVKDHMEVDLLPQNSQKRKSENETPKEFTDQNLLPAASNESDATAETKSAKSKKSRTRRTTTERQSPSMQKNGSLSIAIDEDIKPSKSVGTGSKPEKLGEEGGRVSKRKISKPERFGELINNVEISKLFEAHPELEGRKKRIISVQKTFDAEKNETSVLESPPHDLAAIDDGILEKRKLHRRRSKPERLGFENSEPIYENYLATHNSKTKIKSQRRHSEVKDIITSGAVEKLHHKDNSIPELDPESSGMFVGSAHGGVTKDSFNGPMVIYFYNRIE